MYCTLGVAVILLLDFLTIISFDSLPQDIESLAATQGLYRVLEEWYSYIGHFFVASFYVILLGCMCVVFLLSAWEGKFKLIPALLIWHSSLGILSTLGKIGQLLSASRPNMFSDVAEGLGELSILPLLLCLVNFMERYKRFFIPFILANCFCSAALLFALVWHKNEAYIYVTQTLSNWFFLLCFLALIFFSILEFRDKNANFSSFLPMLILSVVIVVAFHIVAILVKSGFSVSQLKLYSSQLEWSFEWFRVRFLEAILLLCTSLLIIFNHLRQYHQHMLQLQSLRLRDEANLEYARSLQKYETKVREIKHDISNTLSVAAMLCKNGEYEQLGDYLGTMTSHIASVRTGQYCSHILVNYLLLMFEERFQKISADFRCKAVLPAELDIADNDLASELNNILQNAFDAVQKISEGERWVELTVRFEQSVVRIDCRNPYDGEPIISENGLLRTSKADQRKHGLGLSIIYEIAEKYGGVAVPLFGDGVFELKVAIPNGKAI